MNYQFVPQTLPMMLSALITAMLAFYGLKHRDTPTAKIFALNMFLGTQWALISTLEMSATTLQTKLIWANIQYVSYAITPVTWLLMTITFAGRAHWLTPRILKLMLVIPVLTIILVWTDDALGLVRYGIHLDTAGSFPVVGKEYGPWFWVHGTYSYLCIFTSLGLLFSLTRQRNAVYRMQAISLLTGLALILLSNLLYVSGLDPAGGYDPTPVVFSLTGAVIAWGIFRQHLISLAPIGRDFVVESMRGMMVTVDQRDRIVDSNPAFRDAFSTGERPHSLAGQRLEEVSPELVGVIGEGKEPHQELGDVMLADGLRNFEVFVSPIEDRSGRLWGRAVLIHDVTELMQTREELNLEQQEVAVMEERERIARNLHDDLGQLLSFASVQIQATQREHRQGNDPMVESHLQRLAEITHDAHHKLRSHVYDVRNREFAQSSIRNLLYKRVESFVDNCDTVDWNGVVLNLHVNDYDKYTKEQLVYITQEALSNVLRHAEATSISVSLQDRGEEHELIIEDNGVGMADGEQDGDGSGTAIMHDRARALGGCMTIDSDPGEFTRITVTFPDRWERCRNESNDS